MTIEIAILLSVLSFAFNIWSNMTNIKRSERSDTKTEASQLTAVMVKLEIIGTGVTEIKTELTNVKNEVQESRERIVKVEESTKQAHKRLDSIDARRKEV